MVPLGSGLVQKINEKVIETIVKKMSEKELKKLERGSRICICISVKIWWRKINDENKWQEKSWIANLNKTLKKSEI